MISASYKINPLFTQEPTPVFWVALHLVLMLIVSSTEGLPWDPSMPRGITGGLTQRKGAVDKVGSDKQRTCQEKRVMQSS